MTTTTMMMTMAPLSSSSPPPPPAGVAGDGAGEIDGAAVGSGEGSGVSTVIATVDAAMAVVDAVTSTAADAKPVLASPPVAAASVVSVDAKEPSDTDVVSAVVTSARMSSPAVTAPVEPSTVANMSKSTVAETESRPRRRRTSVATGSPMHVS